MRLLIVVAILAVLSSRQALAQAAPPVPDKAGAFAIYCDGHLKECKNQLVRIDLNNLAMSFDNPKPPCTLPRGLDNEAAARQVAAWIKGHPEVANRSTEDGVNLAVKAIWACAKTVTTADPVYPDGAPMKIGSFLVWCPDHAVACINRMTIAQVGMDVLKGDEPRNPKVAGWCSIPKTLSRQEASKGVMDWLKSHPQAPAADTEASIIVAIKALWPCNA